MYSIPGNPEPFDRYSPRRRKRLTRVLTAVCALAIIAIGVFAVPAVVRSVRVRNPEIPSEEEILAAWDGKDYDGVLALCEEGLKHRPLDPFRLVLSGFASFYRGIGETDGEIRLRYMDAAIFSLRKALTSPAVPFRAQVSYVLGKAYYHKGPYYMDEAVLHLEAAAREAESKKGEAPPDILEYAAVAYSSLGDHGKSVDSFEKALARSKTDLLLLAAARAYVQHGSAEKAEIAALEALSITEDSLVREKSRFLLGELYLARRDYQMAEEQYNLILETNPESADAHYYLGLIWQEKGDPVRARAAWRKAVSLDPMHTAARQKLAERI